MFSTLKIARKIDGGGPLTMLYHVDEAADVESEIKLARYFGVFVRKGRCSI